MENSGIDFELYKVFYVTAKSGNITSAAKKLFLTQPSVSKHIHNLENELGFTLFMRTKKGVSLTPEGRILMRRIEPACWLIYSAENEMRSLKLLEHGSVNIASTEMSFKTYVLPALVSYKEKHPDISVRFSNALNEKMVSMLRDGVIDIAILHEPFVKEGFMELKAIDTMEETAVCSEKYRHLINRKMAPKDLLEQTFISMPDGSSTHEYLTRYFASFGLDFAPDIELTTVELTVQAAESGLGISILPRMIADPLIKEGKLYELRLEHPFPPREVFLITNKELIPSAAVSAFIEEAFA
ncbi:MAG: LysR family transcriptional regulator [Lachnospiraceae bacterium]|nr:LysR family transcriptional regulator [Lachnospiraceae bacterium]